MIIKTSYPFMKPPPSARLIRGNRLAQGLIGAWTMAENGGLQVFDLSGNGTEGTFVNSPTWVAGKFGSAVRFAAGSSQYIDAGTSINFTGAKSFAVVTWFRTSFTASDNYIIGTNNDTGFYLRLESAAPTGRVVVKVDDDVDDAYVFSAVGGYDDGNWHQLALVWTASINQIEGFVDGVTFGTDIQANVGNLNDALWIGGTDAGRFFTGDIDHVVIYNRALSASEIAELYSRPFCMFERKARTALMSGYAVPPVGVAPTGVLSGSLVGCLGGPI